MLPLCYAVPILNSTFVVKAVPEVNVRDVGQLDPFQNIFEGLQVELVLDLRLDHPDTQAKANHVNVGL